MALGDGSAYPTSLDNFTDPQNKVDAVDARYVADLNDAITKIETELGTDPAGSQTDLVTRLAVQLHDDGGVKRGVYFPGAPTNYQTFYRTDSDTFYVYNGTSWVAAQQLSNVLFSWSGTTDYAGSGGANFYYGTGTTPIVSGGSVGNAFYFVEAAVTYQTFLRSKMLKIAGVNTVTCYARCWYNSTVHGDIRVTIGGQTGTSGIDTASTPTWETLSDIDVSGLTNGSVYDITVEMVNDSGGTDSRQYCSSIIMFGS